MAHASTALRFGDAAPDFRLPTQRGEPRSLGDALAKGPVLLAFHRGTWCHNCRRRFGELARQFPVFRQRGIQVLVVVAQQSHPVRRFVEETGVPFNILVDEDRRVVKAYGVWHRLGLDAWNIARPALFLIDREGRIRFSYVADWQGEFPSPETIAAEIDRMLEGVAGGTQS